MELLPIVEAEREADRLLQEAHECRERLIKDAHAERATLLAALTPAPVTEPDLKPLRSDLTALRERAAKNKAKAIAKILEEL